MFQRRTIGNVAITCSFVVIEKRESPKLQRVNGIATSLSKHVDEYLVDLPCS